jgi:peroxiredoxin family protein
MSTDIEPTDGEPENVAALRERIDTLEAELAASKPEAEDTPGTAAIVATKGTLDMAFPPLNLASTAAAFGWNVSVFFTFWGLDVIHEDRSKQLPMSAVGNPNMPVPNLVGVLPGMDAMASRMMKRKMQQNGNAMIEELVELCLDTGVELIACGTTIDMMGYDEDDFYDGVTVGPGAATAFERMGRSDVQLFI